MEIKCKTQDTLPLSALVEFQGELKERDENDVAKIVKSIRKHGYSFPFFVWKHDGINHVLDGHGRLKALQQMVASGEHLPELPVVFVDCKNEADAKELLLKLNSQYGRMTPESVRDFLGDLQIDIEDLALPEGIMDLTLKTEDQDTIDDDEVPEADLENEPDSKPGMVYELGPHRLICGDSTKPETFEKLLDGHKVDLIVTDPPYNVDYEGYNFRTAVKQTGGLVRQCIIWVKNSLVLGRQDYQWRHEPCLYGWKEGAGHYWEGRRDLSTVIDDRPNYKNLSKEELLVELKKRDEEIKTSVIYEDKPSRNEEHPTMKPVHLFERLIRNSSKEEDAVLDPFGGSGTTIIACAKTNRVGYVVEFDPVYCDVIRHRWTVWAEENNREVGSGRLD